MRHSLLILIFVYLLGIVGSNGAYGQFHSYKSWQVQDDTVSIPIDGIRTSDTSFILLLHQSHTFPLSDAHYVVQHHTINGEILWKTSIDIPTNYPGGIIPFGSGWKVFVRNIESGGNRQLIWTVILDESGDVDSTGVASIKTNGTYIPLEDGSYATEAGATGVNLYTASDSLIWSQFIPLTHKTNYSAMSRIDKGFLVTNRAIPSAVKGRAYTEVNRISDDGRLLWHIDLKSSNDEYVMGSAEFPAGGYLIYGFERIPEAPLQSQLFLYLVDEEGEILDHFVDSTADQIPSDALVRGDGSILIAANTGGINRFTQVSADGKLRLSQPSTPRSNAHQFLIELSPSTFVGTGRLVYKPNGSPVNFTSTLITVYRNCGNFDGCYPDVLNLW